MSTYLPPEILNHILENVETKGDLSAASLVFWSWFLSARPLLFRTLVLAGKPDTTSLTTFLENTPHICGFVHNLTLRGAGSGTMLKDVVSQIRDNSFRLGADSAIYLSADGLATILARLPRLQTLRLSNARFRSSNSPSRGPGTQQLQSLVLEGIGHPDDSILPIIECMALFSTVGNLDLGYVAGLLPSPDTLSSQASPDISALSVSHLRDIGQFFAGTAFCRMLATTHPRLAFKSIEHECPIDLDAGVFDLLRVASTSIECLDLFMPMFYADDGLISFPSVVHALHECLGALTSLHSFTLRTTTFSFHLIDDMPGLWSAIVALLSSLPLTLRWLVLRFDTGAGVQGPVWCLTSEQLPQLAAVFERWDFLETVAFQGRDDLQEEEQECIRSALPDFARRGVLRFLHGARYVRILWGQSILLMALIGTISGILLHYDGEHMHALEIQKGE